MSVAAAAIRTAKGNYIGVLRAGRKVVVECGHCHHNRDMATQSGGKSARACISEIVLAAEKPTYAEELIARTRSGWQRLQDGFWQYTAKQIEQAKADSAAAADRLALLIEKVRGLDVAKAATRTEPVLVAAAPKIGEMPAWMYE